MSILRCDKEMFRLIQKIEYSPYQVVTGKCIACIRGRISVIARSGLNFKNLFLFPFLSSVSLLLTARFFLFPLLLLSLEKIDEPAFFDGSEGLCDLIDAFIKVGKG